MYLSCQYKVFTTAQELLKIPSNQVAKHQTKDTMKITLRQRKKGNKIILYLDYYDRGKRKYEYLGLYLFPQREKGTLSKVKKEENKKTLALAEKIRAKRYLESHDNPHILQQKKTLKVSFLTYYNRLMQQRKGKGNYGAWLLGSRCLQKYCPADVTFNCLNAAFMQSFKDYLDVKACTKEGRPFAQNTKGVIFKTIKTVLREAVREGIIKHDPTLYVRGFKPEETTRLFLTLEEIQALAQTPCQVKEIKTAFIFSCLTGLRWSDIHKLTWEEVQHSKEMGYYIRFRQKKTRGLQTLPISDQARKLLEAEKAPQEKVFTELKYNPKFHHVLASWIRRAGITKKITFHCARHTYATLQLTLGTDIYTVSKLLGHCDLAVTQVYAKIIDSKKKEAAQRIQLTL